MDLFLYKCINLGNFFQDEIILSSSEDHILFMKYLGPIYEKLVNILITKAQLPGVEQNFSKQDLESFRCYRQDISDTLVIIYIIKPPLATFM